MPLPRTKKFFICFTFVLYLRGIPVKANLGDNIVFVFLPESVSYNHHNTITNHLKHDGRIISKHITVAGLQGTLHHILSLPWDQQMVLLLILMVMTQVSKEWTETLCCYLRLSSELAHRHSHPQCMCQSNLQLQWNGKYIPTLLGGTS